MTNLRFDLNETGSIRKIVVCHEKRRSSDRWIPIDCPIISKWGRIGFPARLVYNHRRKQRTAKVKTARVGGVGFTVGTNGRHGFQRLPLRKRRTVLVRIQDDDRDRNSRFRLITFSSEISSCFRERFKRKSKKKKKTKCNQIKSTLNRFTSRVRKVCTRIFYTKKKIRIHTHTTRKTTHRRSREIRVFRVWCARRLGNCGRCEIKSSEKRSECCATKR